MKKCNTIYFKELKEEENNLFETNGIVMTNLNDEEAEKFTNLLNSDERFNMLYSDPNEPVEFIYKTSQEDTCEHTIYLTKQLKATLLDYEKNYDNYEMQSSLIRNISEDMNTDSRMPNEQKEIIRESIENALEMIEHSQLSQSILYT